MITMKDIARLANTSVGTVDRALNNRPEVNKETRQKILRIAESLNYTPNHLGKALVLRRQNIKLGFILEPTVNPYFLEIKNGVEKRKIELEHYDITTHVFTMNSYDEKEQIRLLEQLRELGVSGIALNAINSPGVQEKIDALVDQGIRVVTCNTDNSSSKRNCFVGFENELSGRVAAEILAKLTGETGDFIVGIGLKYILAHMHRLKGFSDKMRESYPDIQIREVIETGENDARALEKTLAALDAWPRVKGVYVTSYGANGIINALKIKKPDHRIRVLCHDHTPETDEYVNEGLIDAIICQDGARHGYEAMKILGEMVINNKEPKHQIYLTKLEIKFKENLHTPSQNWDI